jgi:hypothetical protein
VNEANSASAELDKKAAKVKEKEMNH